jgi:hypothetical protein
MFAGKDTTKTIRMVAPRLRLSLWKRQSFSDGRRRISPPAQRRSPLWYAADKTKQIKE